MTVTVCASHNNVAQTLQGRRRLILTRFFFLDPSPSMFYFGSIIPFCILSFSVSWKKNFVASVKLSGDFRSGDMAQDVVSAFSSHFY